MNFRVRMVCAFLSFSFFNGGSLTSLFAQSGYDDVRAEEEIVRYHEFLERNNYSSAQDELDRWLNDSSHSNDSLGFAYVSIQNARLQRINRNFPLAKQHLDTALALINLHSNTDLLKADYFFVSGEIDDRLGRSESSLTSHKKALSLRIKHLGAGHPEVGQSYMGIGDVYRWLLNDFLSAERYYRQALSVAEINSPGDSRQIASICYGLATTYRLQTDYANAELYAFRSLNIYEALNVEGERRWADIHNVIANIYFNTYDFEKALVFIQKTIRILKQQGADERRLLIPYNTLASIYFGQKSFNQALTLYKKIHNDNVKYWGDSSIQASNTLLNLGLLYKDLGDYQESREYLQKCIRVREWNSRYGKKHRASGEAHRFLAEIHEHFGYDEEALLEYNKALIAQIPGYSSLESEDVPALDSIPIDYSVLRILKRKGKTLKRLAEKKSNENQVEMLEVSLKYLLLAIEIVQKNRVAFEQESSKLFVLNYNKELFELSLQLTDKIASLKNQSLSSSQIWNLMNKGKSQILVEYLSRSRGRAENDRNSRLLSRESMINKDIQQAIDSLDLLKAREVVDDELVNVLEGRLSFLLLQKDSLVSNLREMDYQNSSLSPSKLSSVAESTLNLRKAYLQYFWGDSTNTIFIQGIFRGESTFQKVDLVGFKALVDRFKQLVQEPSLLKQDYLEYLSLGNELYERLIPDDIRALVDDLDDIIIFPDGDLEGFPFSALLVDKTAADVVDYSEPDYLLHHVNIAYSKSPDLRKNSPLNTEGSVLAFSYASKEQLNEIASTKRKDILSDIPSTAREIAMISNLFEGQFFYDSSSHKGNLLKEYEKNNILHFAVHGIADFENPSNSRLELQRPNGLSNEYDGTVWAYEIPILDLNDKLVVLSACETSIGTSRRGEGTYSLTRNFQMAGAGAIVSTLWSVDDEASATLLEFFYKELANGKPVASALTLAKRGFIKNAGVYKSHPFYWAGYALDENRTMRFEQSNVNQIRLWVLILIAIVLISIVLKLRNQHSLVRT